jgi:group I intron endonuclease
MKSGIYSIINRLNGKQYVGSSVDIARRFAAHRSRLRAGNHHSRALQRAWVRYGEPAFSFEVLARCPAGMCIAMEQALIDGLTPEYNIAKEAGSRFGVKHTEATKEKMRAAVRPSNRQFTPEHCLAISVAKKGKSVGPISAAHRAALLAANVGKSCSPEKRAKIAAAHVGKKHSAETLEKIRAAARSPEARMRSAAAATAQWRQMQ